MPTRSNPYKAAISQAWIDDAHAEALAKDEQVPVNGPHDTDEF
jgi:hypothetical protein